MVLIILINTGFFIMAAIRLWQQRKNKNGRMDRKNILSWLKAVSFLLLIMGITWILGVVVLEVDALLPLAYIYTIMVAFQGLFIFLTVVAFQESVRSEFIKWWKKTFKKSDLFSKYFSKVSGIGTLTSFDKVRSQYTIHNLVHLLVVGMSVALKHLSMNVDKELLYTSLPK